MGRVIHCRHGMFRPQRLFQVSRFSTTYAHRHRARLPLENSSGHEITEVGHDLVTLEPVDIIQKFSVKIAP